MARGFLKAEKEIKKSLLYHAVGCVGHVNLLAYQDSWDKKDMI